MERTGYEWNIEVNKTHWWFRARNLIIKKIILSNFKNRKNLKILDMGCGSGANLKMLSEFGEVYAIEPDEQIREYAQSENPNCKIVKGSLPNDNPFKDENFDLIISLDVLEHIEYDASALEEMKNMLKDNGKIIITVPAFQFLFSKDDVNAHHFRRYNTKMLKDLIKNTGFTKFKIYFFNTILFLPAAIVKLLSKRTRNTEIMVDSCTREGLINKLLFYIMSFERFTLKLNPIGISLCAVLEKESNE